MSRISAHSRIFEAAIVGQIVACRKCHRAIAAGDSAEVKRLMGRYARWSDVADRLLGWVPTRPAADTAIIPRSEIATALAQSQEAVCSPNFA